MLKLVGLPLHIATPPLSKAPATGHPEKISDRRAYGASSPVSFLDIAQQISAQELLENNKAKSGEETVLGTEISTLIDKSASLYGENSESSDQFLLAARAALNHLGRSDRTEEEKDLDALSARIQQRANALQENTLQAREPREGTAQASHSRENVTAVSQETASASDNAFFNNLAWRNDPVPAPALLRDDAQRLLQALDYYRPRAQRNS